MLLLDHRADGKRPGGHHHAGAHRLRQRLGLLPQVAEREERRESPGGEGDGEHQPGAGPSHGVPTRIRMVKEVLIVIGRLGRMANRYGNERFTVTKSPVFFHVACTSPPGRAL